jgi:aspartate kinase
VTLPIIVQKYGGSSVADVGKIRQVAEKVVASRRAGNQLVVVVSAMGKATDGLVQLAEEAAGPGHEPSRRELDMLLTTGERVTMSLLSIAIASLGEEAISFTGSQSGILTNDRHFDARIIEVRPYRIEDELARGRIVIVAGYQGMSYKREITTLGRGGSDTTAVALAAALNAARCEIYSDVDGVYSGDPRVIGDAKHLPEIALEVLQEMAEAGAKVLNAQAVGWARSAKIAIYARRTADDWAGDEGPSRQTVAAEGGETRGVRAVVGLDRVVHVTLPTDERERFLAVASGAGLSVVDLHSDRATCSFTLPLLNVPNWSGVRERLLALGADITLDLALVSVVGEGLSGGDAMRNFDSSIKAAGATSTRLSVGPLRIGALVSSATLAATQRALHEAFVK